MVRLSIKHIKLSWQVFFNTGRSISISISNDLVYCFSTVYESSDKKQSICAVYIYIPEILMVLECTQSQTEKVQ